MSRSINTNTPARRRNNLFLGRRLTYSPDTPLGRRLIYPPDTPRAAPRSTPVPRQQSSTPEHVVGDRRAPLRASYFVNNAYYHVHGNAEFRPPNDETIHNEPTHSEPRSPNYSPIHSPTYEPRSPNFSPTHTNTFIWEDGTLRPPSSPPAQIEVSLYCHICSCTYTDLQNYNSTFVASTECHHAVCFKCYVSIVFDKQSYRCSVCNRTTTACRAYNRDGVVELRTVRTLRDREAIKTHWNNLFKHNILDCPVDDKNSKLQAQLDESRALTALAQHKADMATSDNQMLRQQLECKTVQAQIKAREKLVLQQQYDALRAANDKLQSQLDDQVAATKVKMEKFAQQHATLMENYKKLVDK
ncbi:immediate early protein 2 [Samia ricini nucleopolyhedrovirus]|nr:ie-2 [Philosamia cynthia ricini nucleopolyhedrovirus virus]BBD51073.1 immediate early protein 2 [Samia ricini nucleopolyhedrovirus]BBD51222.1 immediate early protein 2 [Samia ricini nucleopolyhedrovirus]BBD51374.1 immediate early protein 2 [Samia ricini nucleopolyhedrovirus]